MTPSMPRGLVPPDLQNRLKASITGFVGATIRPTVEHDKVAWNAKIRRNELYYRGQQYNMLYPQNNGLIDYQAIGIGQNLGITANMPGSEELYDYVLNFFQGDVDTFIAVLGARSPNGQAQARDLSDDGNVRLKMKADRVNAFLESHWNVPILHQQLVRGTALYGTMFSYTRWVVNRKRYGTTQETSFDLVNVPTGPAFYQCPNCGTETLAEQAQTQAAQTPGLPPDTVPCSKCGMPMGPENLVQPDSEPSLVPNQVTHYPNGSVECTIRNPAHVTTMINARDLDYASWLIDETEEDKGALVGAYPELRSKAYSDSYVLDRGASTAMGRYTRDLLTSATSTTVQRTKGRWLHTQIWIAPNCYEYLPNDRQGDLRDYLEKTYPDGLKAPMVNGELLVGSQPNQEFPQGVPTRIVNERLTSVWAACKPKPSEMIYADPYFECMIQATDNINDAVNMLYEQAERSNPFVIADPEVLDPDMLRNQNSIPGEFKFTKAGAVGALDKAFFRVPAAELNPVLIQFIDKQIGWCREITGITEAIFGGMSGKEKTAREAELNRNQALMKLNTPWTNYRQFWARTRENGIYQAAKYSGGTLLSSDPRGTVDVTQIDGIWELINGGWYMECEESMPETIGQRRDWLTNALTMPPEVQSKILGIDDPNNVIHIQESAGMSDWNTPGYSTVIRLHDIIGRLSNAAPLPGQPGPPGPPDPITGAPGPPAPPGPPQSSIPFDGKLFDPQLAIKVVQEWLRSDKGSSLEMSNNDGYNNVRAYLDAIHDAMPPNAPPVKPAALTITANIQDLAPEAQNAIFQKEGFDIPPGVIIALPKPPPAPKMPGAPGQGPGPENPLAAPPPNGIPPSDKAGGAPLPGIAAPPPGVLQ